MIPLDRYIDQLLAGGRATFSKAETMAALQLTEASFLAVAARLIKKERLASPKRGFYLVLRPEDKVTGAPPPARWIDPLLRHVGVGYRISLLRAAAFHGSTHQAAMVFQVIAPKQIPDIVIGRHAIQFVYQGAADFQAINQPQWLDSLKTDAGFATIAGVEVTLLDCARYFHKAGGINGLAQVVRDIGKKASARKLAAAAAVYENSTARRLGYLLEHFGHAAQARALVSIAGEAKSFKDLDPSIKSRGVRTRQRSEKSTTWKLTINQSIEIDT